MSELKPNEAQQRLIRVVNLLGNDVVQGYAPGQIANALNVPASYITRDLQNLVAAGWVVQNPHTGHYIIGPSICAIAVKGVKTIHAASQKMAEMQTLFSA